MENDKVPSDPGRPRVVTGEFSENLRDENQILSDQDQTLGHDLSRLDENMGAKTESLDVLEDEPAEFMRGEIDVKTQMDRTERAIYEPHKD